MSDNNAGTYMAIKKMNVFEFWNAFNLWRENIENLNKKNGAR